MPEDALRRTFVVKRSPELQAQIIQNRDVGALEALMHDPVAAIARATIEFFSHGPVALLGPAVRVVQGALKGSLFTQLARKWLTFERRERSTTDLQRANTGFKAGWSCTRLSTMTRRTRIGSKH